MIAREPEDAAAAYPVKAAVSDVSNIKIASQQRQRRTCGSHSIETRVLFGIVLDARVGSGKRLQQSRLRVAVECPVVDLAHRLHRKVAGFLSAFVTAHAISHDRQTSLAGELFLAGRLPIQKASSLFSRWHPTSLRLATSMPVLIFMTANSGAPQSETADVERE